jgi:hypothetical protein
MPFPFYFYFIPPVGNELVMSLIIRLCESIYAIIASEITTPCAVKDKAIISHNKIKPRPCSEEQERGSGKEAAMKSTPHKSGRSYGWRECTVRSLSLI